MAPLTGLFGLQGSVRTAFAAGAMVALSRQRTKQGGQDPMQRNPTDTFGAASHGMQHAVLSSSRPSVPWHIGRHPAVTAAAMFTVASDRRRAHDAAAAHSKPVRKNAAPSAQSQPPTLGVWLQRSETAAAEKADELLSALVLLAPVDVAAQLAAVVPRVRLLLSTPPPGSQRLEWLEASGRACAMHRGLAAQVGANDGVVHTALCTASAAEAEHACVALDSPRLVRLSRAHEELGVLCGAFWGVLRANRLALALAAPAQTASMLRSAAGVLHEHALLDAARPSHVLGPVEPGAACDSTTAQPASVSGTGHPGADSVRRDIAAVQEVAEVLWADAVLKLPLSQAACISAIASAAPLIQPHVHVSEADRDAVAAELQRKACNFAPADAAAALAGLAQAGWHRTSMQAEAVRVCAATVRRLLLRMPEDSVADALWAASRLVAAQQDHLLPDALVGDVCAHALQSAQSAGGRAAVQVLRACVDLRRAGVPEGALLSAIEERLPDVLPELSEREVADAADALDELRPGAHCVDEQVG